MKGSEVIEKMKTGWKLKAEYNWGGHYRYLLSKDGENSLRVREVNVSALEAKNLIEIVKETEKNIGSEVLSNLRLILERV